MTFKWTGYSLGSGSHA